MEPERSMNAIYHIAVAPRLTAGIAEGNRVDTQVHIQEHRFRLTQRRVVSYICESCYGLYGYEVPPEARSPEWEASSMDEDVPALVVEWMQQHAQYHERMRRMAEAAQARAAR